MQLKTTACALILAGAGAVYCDTEIVKLPTFPALELPVEPSSNWPVISTLPERNSGLFKIHPIALGEDRKNNSIPLLHDVWVVLEVDEWRRRRDIAPPNAFTLRVSWPASMAVDFDISIFRPSASQVVSKSTAQPTWIQYARLRAYSTGFRVPRDSKSLIIDEIAQFNLILEPLLWDVIPHSVVPTLLFLFTVVGLSAWMVPRVLSRLWHVAEEARVEVDQKRQ